MPRRPACSLDPGVDSNPVSSSSTEPCCADLRGRSVATTVAGAEYAVWRAGESLCCGKHVRRQPLRWQSLRRQHVRRRRHVRRHERRHERWDVWRHEQRHVWRWAFRCLRHERTGRQGPAIRDAEHRADAGARPPRPSSSHAGAPEHALRIPCQLLLHGTAHTLIWAGGLRVPRARAQMSFGRLTQMLEMNFEVMQHFLGSLVSLVERVRSMYADAF